MGTVRLVRRVIQKRGLDQGGSSEDDAKWSGMDSFKVEPWWQTEEPRMTPRFLACLLKICRCC